jgi:hypothetical protein
MATDGPTTNELDAGRAQAIGVRVGVGDLEARVADAALRVVGLPATGRRVRADLDKLDAVQEQLARCLGSGLEAEQVDVEGPGALEVGDPDLDM